MFFLRVYIFPSAILRSLYPGEEGAWDARAETEALRARLEAVDDNPNRIFSLWWVAHDAARDAYSKASRNQRAAQDVEKD